MQHCYSQANTKTLLSIKSFQNVLIVHNRFFFICFTNLKVIQFYALGKGLEGPGRGGGGGKGGLRIFKDCEQSENFFFPPPPHLVIHWSRNNLRGFHEKGFLWYLCALGIDR